MEVFTGQMIQYLGFVSKLSSGRSRGGDRAEMSLVAGVGNY